MAEGASPQRAWRAACPNCGAPVEFASAASASAVCSFCRSTLLRDGDALRRIGQSAELFEDHSPLQPGAAGRYQGMAFTLVGRLQLRYADGTWNEWHALFDNGRSGWLSEDNGAYVFAFDAPLTGEVPPLDELMPGERRLVGGAAWNVASVVRAAVAAAQGELPSAPRLDGSEFTVVDLRNERDEVATLDAADPQRPGWSVGRPVRLADLAMTGLREAADATLGGRGVECPSCGAALAPTLASTQSIVCGQCKAVVDLSQGVGADLAHFAQANAGHDGAEPRIALGRTGRLALGGPPLPWQVVGYVERCDLPEPGDDDEQTFWREYLVYNRQEGFAFLVDAEDGWSWMRPLTGAPQVRGEHALWKGRSYLAKYTYGAQVTWVLGEFYWRLARDERAQVTDYVGQGNARDWRLAREVVGREVTWSEGGILPAKAVGVAFGIDAGRLAPAAAPAGGVSVPLQIGPLLKVALIVAVVAVMIILSLLESQDDCSAYRSNFGEDSPEYQQCVASGGGSGRVRSSGGSFGGFSTGGGGHK